MKQKILNIVYVNLIVPFLCCYLLPQIVINAKSKFELSYLYEDILKASIFNSVVFGIAVFILCFLVFKLLNTMFLNVILAISIIFFLFWQLAQFSTVYYQASFNYINILLAIYVSSIIVNAYCLMRNKKQNKKS